MSGKIELGKLQLGDWLEYEDTLWHVTYTGPNHYTITLVDGVASVELSHSELVKKKVPPSIPCFVCGNPIEASVSSSHICLAWDVPQGVSFIGGSNFGSKHFDAAVDGIHLQIVICDECIEKNRDRGREVVYDKNKRTYRPRTPIEDEVRNLVVGISEKTSVQSNLNSRLETPEFEKLKGLAAGKHKEEVLSMLFSLLSYDPFLFVELGELVGKLEIPEEYQGKVLQIADLYKQLGKRMGYI